MLRNQPLFGRRHSAGQLLVYFFFLCSFALIYIDNTDIILYVYFHHQVILTECLHTAGVVLLVFKVLPELDSIRAGFLLNATVFGEIVMCTLASFELN